MVAWDRGGSETTETKIVNKGGYRGEINSMAQKTL